LAHKLLSAVPTPFSFSVVQPSLSSTSSEQCKREKWKSKIAGITDLRIYEPRSVKKKKTDLRKREKLVVRENPQKTKLKTQIYDFSIFQHGFTVGLLKVGILWVDLASKFGVGLLGYCRWRDLRVLAEKRKK
jgi:hypothetical protein